MNAKKLNEIKQKLTNLLQVEKTDKDLAAILIEYLNIMEELSTKISKIIDETADLRSESDFHAELIAGLQEEIVKLKK